jgi:hypothetical protein
MWDICGRSRVGYAVCNVDAMIVMKPDERCLECEDTLDACELRLIDV